MRSDENKYDIEIALAGFNRDDIDVSVEDSVLTIETKRSMNHRMMSQMKYSQRYI